MKAVLISIQPKWCELIASGKKTIEVRKTKPKLETPFKVYIYCTKAKEMHHNGCIVWYEDSLFSTDKGEIKYGSSLELWGNNYEHGVILNGKVIGEFVCNYIKEFETFTAPDGRPEYYFVHHKDTCLGYKEFREYGKGKPLYGWYITNLKIYDKPKELSEFLIDCKNCGKKFVGDPNCWQGCVNGYRRLTRPPQSWCYVERKE